MFECRVALKYLLPKWRQLSVSLISLISILVIALVVWLLVVFFSVNWGLHQSWTEKLLALTAPVRITPTQAYHDSYYARIDALSAKSNYTPKTLDQKLSAQESDPYDPETDEEIPQEWPKAVLNSDGSLKDLVREAYTAIEKIPVRHVSASDFEIAQAGITFYPIDKTPLSYTAYVGSYDGKNPMLQKSVLDGVALSETLPSNPMQGEGILLPKGFKEAGITIGNSGMLHYKTPTATAFREQHLPVFVAGFYDPGIISFGKPVIANKEITHLLRAAQESFASQEGTGIHVRFDPVEKAPEVKKYLEKEFAKRGISPYWKIETYQEFEFAKDFLQQMRSEDNLFSIISGIILIVACSNIVSMLIILVNDKKKEIGILRAMGASTFSIAAIFAFSGLVMGTIGSLIGVFLATVTLKNIHGLIGFISDVQGFDAFNPHFFGDTLPSQMNGEALFFVIGLTALISLIAGLIPAIKACNLRPSILLRSE